MADPTPGEIRHKVQTLRDQVFFLKADISSKLRDPTSVIDTKARMVYKMFTDKAENAKKQSHDFWKRSNLQKLVEKERLVHKVNQTSNMFINDLDMLSMQLEELSLDDLRTNRSQLKAFQKWSELDAQAQEIHGLCELLYDELFTEFPDLPIHEPEGFETPCDIQDMQIVQSASSTRANIERLHEIVAQSQELDPLADKFSTSDLSEDEETPQPMQEEEEKDLENLNEFDLLANRRLVDEELQRVNEAITVNENAIQTLSNKTEGFFNIFNFNPESNERTADESKLADLREEQNLLRQRIADLQSRRTTIVSRIQGQ